MQRFRCGGCAHVFTPPSERSEVVDAVVDAVLKTGISAAARRFGRDCSSVAGMLSRWLAARDAAARQRHADLPDVMAVAPLRVQGRDCLLLCDPVDERLLDLIPGVEALPEWLAGFPAPPLHLALGIDARAMATLSAMDRCPSPVVPPATARRAIESASLVSFRAMVRAGVAAGRNYRESAALLRRPDAALSAREKEELSAWHPRLRRFRFAVLTLLEDLADAAADRFAVTAGRVAATLAATAPGCALHLLLERWREAIVAGVRHRWLDWPLGRAAELTAEIRRLRPTAGFDTLRAILLHADADPRPAVLDAVATLRALSGGGGA